MKRHARASGGDVAEIPIGKGWRDASGVAHPARARELWTREELAAADLYGIHPHPESADPQTHRITGRELIFDAAAAVVLEKASGEPIGADDKAARLAAEVEARYLLEMERQIGDIESRLGKTAKGAVILDAILANPAAAGALEGEWEILRADAATFARLQAARDAKLAAIEAGEEISLDGGWEE